MHSDEITIRAGQRDDAEFIATVVCMALDSTPEEHPLYPVFRELAGRDKAQYSYRNALIAEVDGRRAGGIVGYDGARLHELREPIYALIQQQLGQDIVIEEEISAGEFYLDSVAVLPEYRNKGIGAALLTTLRDKAFSEGHKYVGLLVDTENNRAEALYRTIGFERVNATTFLGIPMWHMQCKIRTK